MNNTIYGYVRVSTKEQNLDRQISAMEGFGIPDKQIYQKEPCLRMRLLFSIGAILLCYT